MLARHLLGSYAGAAAPPAPPEPPPWPASWLSLAHSNDAAFDNHVHAFTSDDGLAWTDLGVTGRNGRDPALLHAHNKWWSLSQGSPNFDISSTLDYATWAAVGSFAPGVGESLVWAPNWFTDGDSIHALLTLDVPSGKKLWETHPTNDAMTAWSTPVEITGTGFVTNTIDPSLTLYDGTYYLIWKDDDAGTLCLSTSTSPFSGYGVVQTGDWAGWKAGSGSIEGPQIVDIGTGWRIYFTHNSGFNAVAVYYSDTTDRTMATGWSARTALPDFDGYNHPLPIKQP